MYHSICRKALGQCCPYEACQVRKEAAIRSLCRASESIERTGAFWCRDTARPAARYLVSRWSSASPAGSLDYQTPRRRPGPVVQKSSVKARLSNLNLSLVECGLLVLSGH